MNLEALIFMGLSWGLVIGLSLFCFKRLFSSQSR